MSIFYFKDLRMTVSFLRKAVVGIAFTWLACSAQAGTISRTYTAFGQVASVDGARTDVNDVTQYAYDAQGNLTNVTNALGQVYALASFDSYGNPQSITDPNGVVTTLSYTP
ncbi:RHS repeat domain-containing protein, partial [Pseudomonas coronafaciens]|uniref:RHS repeat domain-containing protein n=1 Tax=Pseudomonas coronafaciens TaxID=53409 RepID=UPI00138F3E67